MRRLRWAAMFLVLLGSACGEGAGGSASPASPTAPTSSPTIPNASTTAPGTAMPPAGAPVPKTLDFTAAGVDGGQVEGADFAGKDVAMWFWAPW